MRDVRDAAVNLTMYVFKTYLVAMSSTHNPVTVQEYTLRVRIKPNLIACAHAFKLVVTETENSKVNITHSGDYICQ